MGRLVRALGLDRCPHEAPFSRHQGLALVWITLAGAALRGAYQWDRALLGDEVGTLVWTRYSVTALLSHFDTWGSMNYFIALEKAMVRVLGEGAWSLCLVPLVSGIATIPLTAWVGRRLGSAEVGLAAAALVAVNPYLMKFSATARSYVPLVALSLAALVALLRWRARPTLGRAVLLALLVLAMILMHPNGAYSLAFFVLVLLAEGLHRRADPAFARPFWTLVALLGAIGLALVVAYHRMYPDMVRVGHLYQAAPPTSLAYAPYVFSDYFGGRPWPRLTRFEDRGYGSPLPIALAAATLLAGLASTARRHPCLRPLLAAVVIPMLALSLQGMSHYPWAFARFLIAVVPLLIILLAAGAAEIGLRTRYPRAVAWAVLSGLALSWVPATVEAFRDKLDFRWQQPATFLNRALGADDVVLGGSLECLHLQPYLRDAGICYSDAEAVPRRDRGGLYLVSAAPSLAMTRPGRSFGRIHVTYYPDAVDERAMQGLRDELASGVGGRPVNVEWAPVYRLLLGLSRRLGVEEDQRTYFQLWQAAERGQPFWRFMPPGVRAQHEQAFERLRPS